MGMMLCSSMLAFEKVYYHYQDYEYTFPYTLLEGEGQDAGYIGKIDSVSKYYATEL